MASNLSICTFKICFLFRFTVDIAHSYRPKYWKTWSSFLQLFTYENKTSLIIIILERKSLIRPRVTILKNANFLKKLNDLQNHPSKPLMYTKKKIIYTTPSKHKVNKLLKYENYLTWDENKEFSPGV